MVARRPGGPPGAHAGLEVAPCRDRGLRRQHPAARAARPARRRYGVQVRRHDRRGRAPERAGVPARGCREIHHRLSGPRRARAGAGGTPARGHRGGGSTRGALRSPLPPRQHRPLPVRRVRRARALSNDGEYRSLLFGPTESRSRIGASRASRRRSGRLRRSPRSRHSPGGRARFASASASASPKRSATPPGWRLPGGRRDRRGAR